MKKISICVLLGITLALLLSTSFVNGEEIDTEGYNIVISTGDNALQATETLTIVDGDSNQTYGVITLWLQNGANNVEIFVNDDTVIYTTTGNEYNCNLSSMSIKMDTTLQIRVSYNLNKDTAKLSKTMIYNASSFSVKFDGNDIYTSENLASGFSFDLTLFKTTENESNMYFFVIIGVLVLLLLITIFYFYRKQKTAKVKQEAGESEELLNTKKNLLMESLKDIEKQHRAKEISDDTYHKLREQYKQQALETMKKLEDMKSKIK